MILIIVGKYGITISLGMKSPNYIPAIGEEFVYNPGNDELYGCHIKGTITGAKKIFTPTFEKKSDKTFEGLIEPSIVILLIDNAKMPKDENIETEINKYKRWHNSMRFHNRKNAAYT